MKIDMIESISSDGGQGFSSSSSSSSSSPPVPIISRRRDVVGLSLELGQHYYSWIPDANSRPSTTCLTKKEDITTYGGRFTFLQLEELHQQALIYKYMEAGLPVPSHLILPIWKSVATSFASLTGTGCNSSIYGEYTSNAEVEPGRCKRTDGKKWRCAKDVVPYQKYCQKHLHRGRHRSRKLVETPTTNSTSATSSHPASN